MAAQEQPRRLWTVDGRRRCGSNCLLQSAACSHPLTHPPCPRSLDVDMQDWCRAHGAEVLAVQPPGRNMRGKEVPMTTAKALAQASAARS